VERSEVGSQMMRQEGTKMGAKQTLSLVHAFEQAEPEQVSTQLSLALVENASNPQLFGCVYVLRQIVDKENLGGGAAGAGQGGAINRGIGLHSANPEGQNVIVEFMNQRKDGFEVLPVHLVRVREGNDSVTPFELSEEGG